MVTSSLAAILKGRIISKELGLPPSPVPVGSWPVSDVCGFQVAMELLRASQYPGRNVKEQTQFDSIKKIRTGYSNAYESRQAQCYFITLCLN